MIPPSSLQICLMWPWPLTFWPLTVLQCYDTVGWVMWPVKPSPKWQNVSSGTLNSTILYYLTPDRITVNVTISQLLLPGSCWMHIGSVWSKVDWCAGGCWHFKNKELCALKTEKTSGKYVENLPEDFAKMLVKFPGNFFFSFRRAMLGWRAYAVMRCVSVRLSITFLNSVKTSNRILNFFHRRVAT